jgi:hypothetical protein
MECGPGAPERRVGSREQPQVLSLHRAGDGLQGPGAFALQPDARCQTQGFCNRRNST